jgi:RNA polymerase sigma-70 factor, ECF subfamily
MRLRSRRRKPEESIDALLPGFKADGHFAERFASGGLTAEQLLERKDTRRIVRDAIAELPDPYRTVLILRDIEEMSTQEVADALEITPAAVKVRLHRARQALFTLLRHRYQVPAATR